jgi:cell division protein FtsW
VTDGNAEHKLVAFATLGLVAFGLVMVYSATSASAALGDGDPMSLLKRQAVYALIGVVLMALLARLDYHRLRYVAPPLLLVALALCAAVLVLGPQINGARRWFLLGPASFQPSELAKVALCLFAAAYLARQGAPRTFGQLVRPLGLLTAIFCGLILLEPDLGTTITLCGMMLAVFLVAGAPVRLLLAASVLATAVGLLAIWVEPYRRARVFSFLDPWSDAQGSGFQIVQATIGIGSGGFTGAGLGEGVGKISYLPEAHTDMIFAVVGEELGLIGSVLVIGAFAVFAVAGFRVALRCRDPFGKLLAAGITALVSGQAAINLAAVLGIAPLTGIPLPFVSYGGSSLVVLLAGVGILLNIAVNGAVDQARVPHRGGRNSRARPARARGRRGAAGAGRDGDLRRVARPRRVASGRILARRRPEVVLGAGGYVAGPMALAARLHRIPAALTEADAHLGLANRLAAPFARRVFLAYGIPGRGGEKYRVTGRPVPASHLGAGRDESRARFGLPLAGPVLAFFGGLAGAQALNRLAADAFGKAGPAVLHVSGERDYEELRARVERPDYVLLPSTDDFGAALAVADLAVSRAGGTVWELAAAGTPSVLVPYPHATADHQALNARYFEEGGGAVVVDQRDLARVPALVEELLGDPARLARMSAAMRALARPHAADEIADELVRLAQEGRGDRAK